MDDGPGELVGRCVAAEILRADLSGLQHVVNGIVDLLAVVKQVDVTQHLRGAEKHRARVGDVLADSFGERVARSLKKVN